MSKRSHRFDPAPIQDVLGKLLKPADLRHLEFLSRIRQVWEQCLDASLLAQSELVDFQKKTLYVEVSGNPWAQELHFLKPRILAALERALGPKKVLEIKFRVK